MFCCAGGWITLAAFQFGDTGDDFFEVYGS